MGYASRNQCLVEYSGDHSVDAFSELMADARLPILIEFESYVPPSRLERSVERLVESLQPSSLTGLDRIVLSDRNRYTSVSERAALAFYHQRTRDREPWIELIVDNIFAGFPAWVLRVSVVRELLIAGPFFHEVAHHRNAGIAGMRANSHESRADEWSTNARREYCRRYYWYLVPVARLVVYIMRRLRRGSRASRIR